jgi:hypothetical protein
MTPTDLPDRLAATKYCKRHHYLKVEYKSETAPYKQKHGSIQITSKNAVHGKVDFNDIAQIENTVNFMYASQTLKIPKAQKVYHEHIRMSKICMSTTLCNIAQVTEEETELDSFKIYPKS